MHTETRFGTFDDVLSGVDEDLESIVRRLRALIKSVHPDAFEIPRPAKRTITYGIGPRKASEAYAQIGLESRHVNLGFPHGGTLRDPDGLLEGTGKALRHVKIRSGADADLPGLGRLVKAALAERRAAVLREAADEGGS